MSLRLQVKDGLSDVDPAAWDALVGDASPFLEWGWLASLEASGCVAPKTGWLPQHLMLCDGDRLIGACPLYVKGHSDGEFVFDHPWANAATRAGIRYYPKLLTAVPFTPATGCRFLTRPDVDRGAVIRVLGNTLKDICTENALSSAHVNFCLADEAAALAALGFVRRTGYQFQWRNPGGWRTFDDYLAAFRSKRRVQIKRERRELEAQGITITAAAGDAIDDGLFEPMFALYMSTIDKYTWGRQYLNRELFELLRRRWKQRLCFIVARRGTDIIAATFNVRKRETMYGRYWGTVEELRYLHFNVCYYAAIDYCLREAVTRFEPGAGGEFKYLRGFDAQVTESMHFIADERLAAAVARHLESERETVASEVTWLGERSPLKG